MDAFNGTNLESLFDVVTKTASANGTGIDVSAYTGIGQVILSSAAGTGTTPTLDVKLQESSDNSTYTDISGATFTQVTDAAAALEGITLDMDAAKQYVRGVGTIGGSTPSFTFAVELIAYKQILT